MITNTNESKVASDVQFLDIKKYIGVASVNIVGINPNNAKLRALGWNLPEDAKEREYVTIVTGQDDKQNTFTTVRFMVQIQDLEDKPVIALDFRIRPEIQLNRDGSKCKIIDAFGRTAWATKDDVSAKKVPQYGNGPAQISKDYHGCHFGEEELVSFLMKYLNITPLQMFDRKGNKWVATKDPDKLTIDDWKALCSGNVSEIAGYVSNRPSNCCKVTLGVVSNENNRSFQTFLSTSYIGNGAIVDAGSGEYASSRKAIDKFNEERERRAAQGFASSQNYTFSASPVKEWSETPTDVQDNSNNLFNEGTPEEDDDLPFGL